MVTAIERCEHGVMVTGNCAACLTLEESAAELAWWDSLTADEQARIDVPAMDWWDGLEDIDFPNLTA